MASRQQKKAARRAAKSKRASQRRAARKNAVAAVPAMTGDTIVSHDAGPANSSAAALAAGPAMPEDTVVSHDPGPVQPSASTLAADPSVATGLVTPGDSSVSTNSGPVQPPVPVATATNNHVLSKRPRTHGFSSILHFNNHLLPGFAPNTLRHLGSLSTRGLQCITTIYTHPLQPQVVSFTLDLLGNNTSERIATIFVPYDTESAEIIEHTLSLEPANRRDLAALFSTEFSLGSDFMPLIRTAASYSRQRDVVEADVDGIVALFPVVDEIRQLCITCYASDVVVLRAPLLWQKVSNGIASDAATIVAASLDSILAPLSSPSQSVQFLVSVAASSENHLKWAPISTRALPLPFAELLNGHDIENLCLSIVDTSFARPRHSLSPINTFVTREHHAVYLAAAAADEIYLASLIEEKALTHILSCKVIPVEGSQWLPTNTDLQDYGTMADSQYQAYFVLFLIDKWTKTALPDIGTPVTLGFECNVIHRSLLAYTPTNDTYNRRAHALADQINLARTKAAATIAPVEVLYDLQQQGYIFWNEYEESYSALWHSKITEWVENNKAYQTFHPKSHATLVEYMDQFVPPAVPLNNRRARCIVLAKEVIADPSESSEEHLDRLNSFVRDNPLFAVSPATPPNGFQFPGRRIATPAGIAAPVALFLVNTPRQPGWPMSLQAPPMMVTFPQVKIVGNLEHFFRTLKITEDDPLSIAAYITFTTDEKTAEIECNGIRELYEVTMNNHLAAWRNYCRTFHNFPASSRRNLHLEFPGLLHGLKQGIFSPEEALIVKSMQTSTAGIVIVIGCPGAGKTTMAVNVVSAMLHHGCYLGAGYPKWAARTPHTADVDPSLPANFRNPRNTNIAVPLSPVRIVWSTPQDAQARDAVKRMSQANPNICCICIHSYDAELRNLLYGSPEVRAFITSTCHNVAIQALVQTANQSFIQDYEDCDPAADSFSLSETILRWANAAPARYRELLAARQLVKTNPMAVSAYKNEYEDLAHSLMERVVRSVKFIAGTPVTIRDLAEHMPTWKPSVIVADNTARMPEPLFLSLLTLNTDAVVIAIGDPSQNSPISKTYKTNMVFTFPDRTVHFTDVFGPQRKTSLLHRAAFHRAYDFRMVGCQPPRP